MNKSFYRCLMIIGMLLVTNFVMAQEVITHTVERGETLESIAKKYNVTVRDIKENNPNIADIFYVGLKIYIPARQKVTENSAYRQYEDPKDVYVQPNQNPNTNYSHGTAQDMKSSNTESYKNSNSRFGYWGFGFFSYDGAENYGMSFGVYNFNGLGFGMNIRSNWKFKDHQNTYNGDVLLNFSLGVYENGDVAVLVTPEVGPSIATRSAYDEKKNEFKDKWFIDGFVGIKATVVYKKVVISAGYHIWAPKWKFGEKEKADGFYAQIGINI